MKKHYYLLGAALLMTTAARAQGTELFFSEYAEGAHQNGVSYSPGTTSAGNERALEIFNPTLSTVSLAPYSVRRYSNGSATPSEEEKLLRSDITYMPTGSNTLNTRSTFVLANKTASIPALVNAANQFSAEYGVTLPLTTIIPGGVTYFNGDDAIALVRYPSGQAGTGTGVIIDIIGYIGTPLPPSGSGGAGNWSGTNPLDGTPPVYVSSANQTIIRRASVSAGTRVNPTPAAYNIADEWYQYSTAFNGPGGTSNPGGQLYDRLGSHNDYTGPFGVYQTTLANKLGQFDAGISLYPNPASGTATVELKDVKVGSIVVLNNLGQRIAAQPGSAATQRLTLDISGLKAGVYFVQFISADGQTKIYKELVVQ